MLLHPAQKWQGVQTAPEMSPFKTSFLLWRFLHSQFPRAISWVYRSGLSHEPPLDFRFGTAVVGEPSAEQHFRGVYSTYTAPAVFKAKADIYS